MRILFASSEAFPLAKTGGLADVGAALPRALLDLGLDVQLILPGYRQALALAEEKTEIINAPIGNTETRLIRARMPGSALPVWLVDCPDFYDRKGSLYRDELGNEWPDNPLRFAHFSRVAALLANGAIAPEWRADVVHLNDWHTSLLPLQLGPGRKDRPGTVLTIHNLAYQGIFAPSVLKAIGVPEELFTPDGLEFYGNVSFLKAGIRYSDLIATVSPSYAGEILTPELGCGLDGLLRQRMSCLSGILNGVDYGVWDPANDRSLPATFARGDLSGKRICKAQLQRELGLEQDHSAPLLVWLSRITDQKMADVVLHTLHRILDRDVQLAMLGEGDPALEGQFKDAAQHYPGRLALRIGYEEPLAHRILGGADILLHPSRFEPCGLTPLYAMRYGTLPIVRHVGGLCDTIVDATEWTLCGGHATGFVFREPTASAMLDCLDRALALFTQDVRWRGMQQRAMSRVFAWDASARRYAALYRKAAPHAQRETAPDTSLSILPQPYYRQAALAGHRLSEALAARGQESA